MSLVATIGNWKKDATPAERLEELAVLARLHPERFDAFVIVYREKTKGRWITRTHRYDAKAENQCQTIDQVLGLLELGKADVIADSEGR